MDTNDCLEGELLQDPNCHELFETRDPLIPTTEHWTDDLLTPFVDESEDGYLMHWNNQKSIESENVGF